MIDIKFFREHPEIVKTAVRNRQMNIDIDEVIKIDATRRKLQKEVDDKRSLKKQAGEKIAQAASGEKKKLIAEMKVFDKEQDKLEEKLSKIEEKFQKLFSQIPNIPLADVPVGADETQNVILREVGKPKEFSFKPKSFYELGETLGIIDTGRAAKVSGSRFGYILGRGAMLELALIRYALDALQKHGFILVLPPVMVREEVMWAMGFLDRHADEIYKIPEDGLRLVGTSEQSLAPMHKDEIFDEKDLPRRYAGFSTCFRRESGSYGKDTKGILRVHQFNKLEMVSIANPKESNDEHELMLSIEESLMQGLNLPYRVARICTGDMGTPSARTWDIETWFPSEGRYRETHSTSTTTDFQSRRLNIRYKSKQVKGLDFVHLLNGTAFAERPLLAILENYQNEDGSVAVPEVLIPYCGFEKIAKA
ncbi:serine--tRNA ligase [Candidatus Uhrbacteria bacterium]|nr:serine--tRNA ligase [Candidatus Uhrbacteria bacterium]